MTGEQLNSVAFFVGVALLGVGLVLEGRNIGDRLQSACGLGMLAIDLWTIGRQGLDPARWAIQPNLIGLEPMCVFGGLMFVIDSAGLPPKLAARVGIGLHVPTILFYEQLRADWKRFDAAIDRAWKYPVDRARNLRSASSIGKRLRRLAAPDPLWASFRDELVDCQDRWIELTRTGSKRTWPTQQRAYSALVARAGQMVEGALADAGIRSGEYRRLRNRVTTSVFVAGLVVAASTALQVGAPSSTDAWLSLKLCVLAGLILAAMLAAVSISERIGLRKR
jgi:hypothetical protein